MKKRTFWREIFTLTLCLLPYWASGQYTWRDVYSADATSYAIRSDGTLWSCGWNEESQLGYETTYDRSSQWKPMSEEHNWEMIAGARGTGFFLKKDGTLWTVGACTKGSSGVGDGKKNKQLVQIGKDSDWTYITSSHFWGYNGYALKKDGSLWGWGDNTMSQLLNNKQVVSVPTQIGDDKDWVKVVSGEDNAIALKKDGTLWAWGSNFNSNLGFPKGFADIVKKPTQIGSDSDWKDVIILSRRTFALKEDGSIWGCGDNTGNFLLAKNTIAEPENPIYELKKLDYGGKVVQIEGYVNGIVVGLGEDNVISEIKIWGINEDGFLGDGKGILFQGSYTDIPWTATPISPLIPKEKKFKKITAGEAYVIAISTEGEMYAWGRNKGGQLGNNVDISMMSSNFLVKPTVVPCPQENVGKVSTPYHTKCNAITLSKKNDSESPWTFSIIPQKTILNGIWIDTNKDYIPQEEEKITTFEEPISIEANNKEVTIYGDYSGLRCSENEITTINLSNHTALRELYCDYNEIGRLDLTNATSLQVLECSGNKISSIDLTPCISLKIIALSANPINSIKWPTENNISYLAMSNGSGFLPTELDLSTFAELEEVRCNGNKLTKLLLPKTEKIKLVACYDNKLTELDINQLTQLEMLICHQNKLTSLDISSNSALEYISLYSNRIGEEEMEKFFNQLPDLSPAMNSGEIFVIDSEDFAEENFCRREWVSNAKGLNWIVYDNKGRQNNGKNPYKGYYDFEDSFEGIIWDGTLKAWTRGSGTESNPFLIETPQHLAYLQHEVMNGKTFEGIYFQQTCDLNMGAKELGKTKGNFSPIGIFDAGYVTDPDTKVKSWQDDSKRFNGHYDGRNHSIMNLYQSYNNNTQKTVGGHGLFGCVGIKGEIANLYLTRSCTFEGDFEGGSLASYVEGKIKNCGSYATVRGTSIIGGLVGVLYGGEITKSFFSGLAFGTMNVGGLTGYMGYPEEGEAKGKTPSIVDAYVKANIQSAYSFVGTAIGFIADKPTLKNIYATGAISGDALNFMKGAFIGALDGNIAEDKEHLDISNCYYDNTRIEVSQASSDGDIAGIKGVSEKEIKAPEFLNELGDSFAEDLEGINHGYPILVKPTFTKIDKVADNSSDLIYTVNGLYVTIEKDPADIVEVCNISGESLLKSTDNTILLPHKGAYLLQVGNRNALIIL